MIAVVFTLNSAGQSYALRPMAYQLSTSGSGSTNGSFPLKLSASVQTPLTATKVKNLRDRAAELLIENIRDKGLGVPSPLSLTSSDDDTAGKMATFILNPHFGTRVYKYEESKEDDGWGLNFRAYALSHTLIEASPRPLQVPGLSEASLTEGTFNMDDIDNIWFEHIIKGILKIPTERRFHRAPFHEYDLMAYDRLVRGEEEIAERRMQSLIFIFDIATIEGKATSRSGGIFWQPTALELEGEYCIIPPFALSDVSYILAPPRLDAIVSRKLGAEFNNRILKVDITIEEDGIKVPDYASALKQVTLDNTGKIYLIHVMRFPTATDILVSRPGYFVSSSSSGSTYLEYFGIETDFVTHAAALTGVRGYSGEAYKKRLIDLIGLGTYYLANKGDPSVTNLINQALESKHSRPSLNLLGVLAAEGDLRAIPHLENYALNSPVVQAHRALDILVEEASKGKKPFQEALVRLSKHDIINREMDRRKAKRDASPKGVNLQAIALIQSAA